MITETIERPSYDIAGHQFDVLTQTCDCGLAMMDLADATPRRPAPSHDDMLNPGTVERIYRQRSTGREIKYRSPK